MRKSRVLVVDDSASMRQLISAVLNSAPDLEVVGHAADPLEARQAIKDLSPDVLTLDVEMPNMSGIDFLERLMRLRPTPVIMVSSLTHRGGEISTRALEIGAIDCVTKPSLGDARPFGDLAEKVRMAATVRMLPTRASGLRGSPAASQPAVQAYAPDGRIVAIGSSTGGVEALTAVLTALPADCAPVVVTQHMPPLFTRSFAERLDKLCNATVAEASDGAPLVPGRIYIAPGGSQHLEVAPGSSLRGSANPPRCRLRESAPVNGHCPSVDVLFRSVVKACGAEAVGVILTGMGRDGAEGLLALREAGATTLGQDAASSLIYGMPKVAFELGAVQRQLSLRKIGAEIAAITNRLDRT